MLWLLLFVVVLAVLLVAVALKVLCMLDCVVVVAVVVVVVAIAVGTRKASIPRSRCRQATQRVPPAQVFAVAVVAGLAVALVVVAFVLFHLTC